VTRQPAILGAALAFPDPEQALTEPNGLLAIGGDLSVERLLLAYRSGIFPWSSDPPTWWSPDPRGVLPLDALHVPRSLGRTLRRAPFTVTRDRAFAAVVKACAGTRRHGNWITPEIIRAYTRLHEAGHAHSVECWRDEELVGGIYGVAVGGVFAGESMFHTADDASKVALVSLVEHLRAQRFALFDIQMVTPTTRSFGAVEMPRSDYLQSLRAAVKLRREF
jgi:leucyl/phenylalanyl-tRNA--protein transferase